MGITHTTPSSDPGLIGAAEWDSDHAIDGPLTIPEGDAPTTPASGSVVVYAKADGRIYSKDDAGVEYGPFDASGGTLSAYPAAIMALTPVAYWRMNETATARAAFDSSGNGFHAGTNDSAGGSTAVAAALIVGDATAGSFNFNPNIALEFDDHAALDVADVFSITAVIRPDSVSGDHMIINRNGNAFNLKTSGTNVRLGYDNWQTLVNSTGVTLATATVYHIVATKNGSTCKIYIDGVDRTGSVTNSTLTTTGESGHIGGRLVNSECFDGRISELAVFDYALTATDASDLFAASGL